MRVPYSYLDSQFANPDWILERIKKNVIMPGSFTLGPSVDLFETKFANLIKTKYAIGVNSGYDALFLPMKAMGIGVGDEVITTVNTFIATANAIKNTGATPVFVDSDDQYVTDPYKIEAAITKRTKAILVVHWAGKPCDMRNIAAIAKKHRLMLFEDACQAVNAKTQHGETCGSIGLAAGFSMHPLKNLNVFGDAGVITTNDKELNDKLRLMRNHGMLTRDDYDGLGYNSRLDSLQAEVGNCLIDKVPEITETRIKNAQFYDSSLKNIPQVKVQKRTAGEVHVYHLYIFSAKDRDGLLKYLQDNQIEARIHYPKPLHLQPAFKSLGYKEGDFPVAEKQAKEMLTLPCHQGLSQEQMQFVVDKIQEYYKGS